jgi:hypothetical protein
MSDNPTPTNDDPGTEFDLYLDEVSHDNPDLHRIGLSLPVPTLITSVGTLSAGNSSIPAREDHSHDLPYTDIVYTATFHQDTATVTATTPLDDAVAFLRDGRCQGHGHFSFTSAGVANKEFKITPTGLVAPANFNAGGNIGTFTFYDASAVQRYLGTMDWDGTDFHLWHTGGNLLGISPNFAVANGDVLSILFDYRYL